MTLEVILLGANCSLRGNLPQRLIQDLEYCLRYKPEGYEYSTAYLNGSWDGWIRLFNKQTKRFPIGLLSQVEILLQINGLDYSIVDERNTAQQIPIKSNLILRDYQEKILQKALERGMGLICAPPGSGKTEIAIELTARIKLPTLFVAPTQEIFYQTQERFKRALNIKVGLIGDGLFEPQQITIATWQTIWRSIIGRADLKIANLLEQFDVIFFDEGHHYGADEIYRVAQYCPARYRFGLSGSPWRNDGADLKMLGACGDLIKVVTASDLIRKGYLVKPYIKFVRSNSKFFSRWLKWQKIYSQGVVDNPERNALIAEEANKLVESGRTTLVLVTHVRHGQLLEKMIPGSVFVSSKASDRRDIVEDFKAGKLKCVVSTPIWDEGLDVPVMDGLVLAGGGKSPVKAVQRVGRGLRPCNRKKDVRIVDFNDKGMRYLGEHSAERFKIYRLEPEFVIEGDIPEVI